jgi:hypothetical protein
MIRKLSTAHARTAVVPEYSPCEHRSVSDEGRVVCARIVRGDRTVSPDVCRACPFMVANCAHLRFSLRQMVPSPLIVRFNGRTEVWDDDPPQVLFEQAACSAKVMRVEDIVSCTRCPLRQPVDADAGKPRPRRRRAANAGKVVPFPGRDVVAATG